MNKILVLSCSTGQGHNSCAKALQEFFEYKSMICMVKDSFSFVSKEMVGIMSRGHSIMYRYVPSLFRWGYSFSECHPAFFRKGTGIYEIITAGAEKLYQYIKEEQFDTVVCTHVFAAIVLTKVMKEHQLSVRSAFIATDYTYYPGMEELDLDTYFIPAKSLVGKYIDSGIPKERIVAAGIPVRRSILKQVEKRKAKMFAGIKENSKHLLIMCGSMGCGPIPRIMDLLQKNKPENIEITVLCGTNEKLRRRLEQKYSKDKEIHIVGYTESISLYMDSADLYLTKPGGLSITEAAVKRLPMVFVNAVAGCEKYNMDLFLNMGAAIKADNPQGIVAECLRILRCDTVRENMGKALQEYVQRNSAVQIYNELKKGNDAEYGRTAYC